MRPLLSSVSSDRAAWLDVFRGTVHGAAVGSSAPDWMLDECAAALAAHAAECETGALNDALLRWRTECALNACGLGADRTAPDGVGRWVAAGFVRPVRDWTGRGRGWSADLLRWPVCWPRMTELTLCRIWSGLTTALTEDLAVRGGPGVLCIAGAQRAWADLLGRRPSQRLVRDSADEMIRYVRALFARDPAAGPVDVLRSAA